LVNSQAALALGNQLRRLSAEYDEEPSFRSAAVRKS
jgi:hypothetical protein